MFLAYENDVGLIEKLLLDKVRMKAGEISHGQVQLPQLHHLLRRLERHILSRNAYVRRSLAQFGRKRRNEHRLSDIADVEAESARGRCRVKGLTGLHGKTDGRKPLIN